MLPGFCAGMWTTPGRARKCAAAPATTMCMHSSRHRASPEHARSVACAYPRCASNCRPHPRWPTAPFVASTFLTVRTQRPCQPHTRARSCEPSPASRNGHARVWSPLHALSVRRGTRHLAAPWFFTHRDECATRSRRVACNVAGAHWQSAPPPCGEHAHRFQTGGPSGFPILCTVSEEACQKKYKKLVQNLWPNLSFGTKTPIFAVSYLLQSCPDPKSSRKRHFVSARASKWCTGLAKSSTP